MLFTSIIQLSTMNNESEIEMKYVIATLNDKVMFEVTVDYIINEMKQTVESVVDNLLKKGFNVDIVERE